MIRNLWMELFEALVPGSWVVAALVAVYSLVLVAGLLGNTLVIYCVWRYPGLHTTTNTYILNLALADEAFLLGLPLLIATMVAGGWPFPAWLCPAYMVTTSINQITSTLFLTVLAADRCHTPPSKICTSFNGRQPGYLAKILDCALKES